MLFIVKHCFLDLCRSWFGGIKFVLASHFLDVIVFMVGFIGDIGVLVHIDFDIWIEGNTSIDELVLSGFVFLEVLLSNLLFSVDQPIFDSVMVEPDLSVSIINLDQFLPVIELIRRIIPLYGLEFIGKSSSQSQLISSILEVRSHFFLNQLLVVIINRDSFH